MALCSPETRTLEKIKALATKELAQSDLTRTLFLTPDEILFLFEEEAANEAGKEARVKGYKVKVRYQPVQEAEKKTRRQAIAQAVLRSFRREKQ